MDTATFNAQWLSISSAIKQFLEFACAVAYRSETDIKNALDDPGKRFYEAAPFQAVSGNTKVVRWNLIGANYTVGFGEESNLRDIIGCPDDDRAHHIIPSQWTFPSGTAGVSHPVVQKAALEGFHPNDGYNGVCLPSTQHHNHPKYNDYVKFQLDQYVANGGAMTPRATNKWLQSKLIKELRKQLAAMPTGANLPTINNYYIPINANRTFISL